MDTNPLHARAVEFARYWMSTSSPELRRIFAEQVEALLRDAAAGAAADKGGDRNQRPSPLIYL